MNDSELTKALWHEVLGKAKVLSDIIGGIDNPLIVMVGGKSWTIVNVLLPCETQKPHFEGHKYTQKMLA